MQHMEIPGVRGASTQPDAEVYEGHGCHKNDLHAENLLYSRPPYDMIDRTIGKEWPNSNRECL